MVNHRQRMFLITVLMVVSCLTAAVAVLFFIYHVHKERVLFDLTATAQSQARIIEAVAQYDSRYDKGYPDSPREATLSQIRDAHQKYKGFGETGEFALAHKEGNRIVFEFRHGRQGVKVPESLPFDSDLAEPMQRALSGLSGTMVGKDYRGETVLAAYEPVGVLNMGIVAKMDLAEFRAPFINAGLLALGITMVVVIFSMVVFRKISHPLVEELETYADSLEQEVAERKEIEKSLREAHEGLDRKVRERTAVLDGINRLFQESLSCDSDKEVAGICLEVAQELTGSKFGFICEINENERFDTIAISDPGWSACRMPETEAALKVDDMEVRGVRAIPLQTKETFISNEPASHPEWIGFPEGHPEMTSFMCTPIMKGGRVFVLIGLGNSETGYGESDKKAVESISTAFKEALNTKRAEKSIRNYASWLEASNRELQSFSYSVSHDLRSPLRAIQGFSNMLMEDCAGQLDPEGQRYVEVIRSEVERMGKLIDDILSISRISRQEIKRSSINMGELVKEIAEESERLNPGRSIEWRIGELYPATGDTVLVRQVLRNLIGNAVKFSQKEDPAIIEIGCKDDSDRNIYFVKDNGVGFDEKYKDKLFGVFQRLHSEDEFEGTGVGLVIVQGIVSRHSGKVWAEGRPGEGATFYFSLPKGE